MKKLVLALAFLLLPWSVEAQTQKSRAALQTEINTNFADNTTGAITPALARTTYLDMTASTSIINATAPGDTAYVILPADRYVYTTTLSTARTWTLPAANALNKGETILVEDAANVVTTANTITVARAGADTINGAATSIVLNTPRGGLWFTTDGVSNWGMKVEALAAGGTGANLSATGGTSQFLKQASVGAAITVVQPACADLSNATAGCSAAAGQLPGTATNDSASSGNVGELISSTVLAGSAVTLTSTVSANVTSVSLTAGDWDCRGNVALAYNGAVATTLFAAWMSTTSATLPTIPNSGGYSQFNVAFTAGVSGNTIPAGSTMRFSLAGTTTVFLSTNCTFSGGTTNAAYGFIGCRRVR